MVFRALDGGDMEESVSESSILPPSFLLPVHVLGGRCAVPFKTGPSTTFSFSLSSVEYPLPTTMVEDRWLPTWLAVAPAPMSFFQWTFGTLALLRISAGLRSRGRPLLLPPLAKCTVEGFVVLWTWFLCGWLASGFSLCGGERSSSFCSCAVWEREGEVGQ